MLFACLGFPLLLFIFELAVIHDLADRRIGGWGNFNEVQTGDFGQFHATAGGNDAFVFALGANQADFAGGDAFVNAGSGVALRGRVMRSAGY